MLTSFPSEIKNLQEKAGALEKDLVLLDSFPATAKNENKFHPMLINETLHTDKGTAGQAILDMCKTVHNTKPIQIGTYRGFKMAIQFESFAQEYHMILQGSLQHRVALGNDIHGNITRIDNLINGIPTRLETTKQSLENVEQQVVNAQVEVQKPFAQEDELNESLNRLNCLNAILNLDEKDSATIEEAKTPPPQPPAIDISEYEDEFDYDDYEM